MKIGILGGTFDPIHNGHLRLARTAYQDYKLDEVWFMPNGNPPHKDSRFIGSDVSDRVRMVELAILQESAFRLEKYEAVRESISYSCDTMEHFARTYPKWEFYFIVGADSLFKIEEWVHPERIFPTCTILAAYRDDIDTKPEMEVQIRYLTEKYHARISLLAAPVYKVSSSELRSCLKEKEDISGLLPKPVEAYIKGHHLYEEK